MLVVPAVAALLAACGGGSGPAEAPQLAEDRSASASVAGLIGFARAQIDRATSDTAEPRAIDGITPPISDTDEPQPL
jgi:hypothetical protein